MPVQELKYCEYFDVDETYFPCIDESAINITSEKQSRKKMQKVVK